MPRRALRILFVAASGSALGPMAAAVLRREAHGLAEVTCVALKPALGIDPLAAPVMRRLFDCAMDEGPVADVASVVDKRFDCAVLLGPDADTGLRFRGNPARVYWAIGEPEFAAPPHERELSLEHTARVLQAYVRDWWRLWQVDETLRPPRKTKPGTPSQPSSRAYWRTRPLGDAPLTLVVNFGEKRPCVNLCNFLLRQGLQVLCDQRYRERPESVSFVPDAVLVRGLDEAPGDELDHLVKLGVLRGRLPETPIILGSRGPLGARMRAQLVSLNVRLDLVDGPPRGQLAQALAGLLNRSRS